MAGLLTLTPSILPNLGSFGLDSVSLRFTPKHVPNRARRVLPPSVAATFSNCLLFRSSMTTTYLVLRSKVSFVAWHFVANGGLERNRSLDA